MNILKNIIFAVALSAATVNAQASDEICAQGSKFAAKAQGVKDAGATRGQALSRAKTLSGRDQDAYMVLKLVVDYVYSNDFIHGIEAQVRFNSYCLAYFK